MKEYRSFGSICVKDEFGFVYNVSKIEYFLYDDDSFKYIFKPNYDIIELLDSKIFQGIQGIDLDLKKEEYIRENIIPTFISERVPQQNREDYQELLEKCHLDFMDPILYLINTDFKYSGDNLFLIKYEDPKNIVYKIDETKSNSMTLLHDIINNITINNNVVINDVLIDHKKKYYNILIFLYSNIYKKYKDSQRIGIEKAKLNNKYKGRKAKQIDKFKFIELNELVNNKQMSVKDASNILGISIYKFYRLRKDLQK